MLTEHLIKHFRAFIESVKSIYAYGKGKGKKDCPPKISKLCTSIDHYLREYEETIENTNCTKLAVIVSESDDAVKKKNFDHVENIESKIHKSVSCNNVTENEGKEESTTTTTNLPLTHTIRDTKPNVPFEFVRDFHRIGKEYKLVDCYLHQLLRKSEIYITPPPVIPRNPELEARCQRLRRQLKQKEYRKMTKNVDRKGMHDSRMNDLKQIRGLKNQIIMFVNIVLSAGGVFFFCYYAFAQVFDTPVRVIVSVAASTITILAEIYMYLRDQLYEDTGYKGRVDPKREENKKLETQSAMKLTSQEIADLIKEAKKKQGSIGDSPNKVKVLTDGDDLPALSMDGLGLGSKRKEQEAVYRQKNKTVKSSGTKNNDIINPMAKINQMVQDIEKMKQKTAMGMGMGRMPTTAVDEDAKDGKNSNAVDTGNNLRKRK